MKNKRPKEYGLTASVEAARNQWNLTPVRIGTASSGLSAILFAICVLAYTFAASEAQAADQNELDGVWVKTGQGFNRPYKGGDRIMRINGNKVDETMYIGKDPFYGITYSILLNTKYGYGTIDQFGFRTAGVVEETGQYNPRNLSTIRGLYRLKGDRLTVELGGGTWGGRNSSNPAFSSAGTRRPPRPADENRDTQEDERLYSLGRVYVEGHTVYRSEWVRLPGVSVIGLEFESGTAIVTVHNASDRTETVSVSLDAPRNAAKVNPSVKRVTVSSWSKLRVRWTIDRHNTGNYQARIVR